MEILTALGVLAGSKYHQSREINFLVEKTYSLSMSYLGLNHKKIFRLLHKGEYSISEIAVDAIAPLFCPDENYNTTALANAFKKWDPPVSSEDEALFFLNKIVAGRIEQHIYYSLREYDPFFSKILDSVNYLVKTGNYKKILLAGRSCIIENAPVNIEGDVIGQDDFEKIPFNLLINRKKLLSALFNYIKTETNFIAAIPINLLVYRIKHINFSDYIAEYNPSVSENNLELQETTNFGLQAAEMKLESSYLLKGKLNDFEARCIKMALGDMSIDLLNGGINPGMYEYLTPYMLELDKQQYLTKYHNILEYLVKVMKSTIAQNLTLKV